MKKTIENKVLEMLQMRGEGLSALQILAALHPRISQPTLWRSLDTLRANGAIIREGRARATRYHARARTDLGALRSLRLHESVAKRLLREPDIRTLALQRLAKLATGNPHGRSYHDRWRALLRGPMVELVRVMTESSEMADVMRKESPMSAFVSPTERQKIFESIRVG